MATVGAAEPPADHVRIVREFTGFLSKNSDQFADILGPKQPEQQQQQDQYVTKQIIDDANDSIKLLINTSNDGLQRTILAMQTTIQETLDTLRDEVAELRSDVGVGVDNCRAITLNGQAQSGQALQALKTTSTVGGVPVGMIPPSWTALGDTVTVESLVKEDPETIRTILAAYGLSLGDGAPARLTRLKKFLGTF